MKGIGINHENKEKDDFLTIKNDRELFSERIKRLFYTTPGMVAGFPDFGTPLLYALFGTEFDDGNMNDLATILESKVLEYFPDIQFERIVLFPYYDDSGQKRVTFEITLVDPESKNRFDEVIEVGVSKENETLV